MQKTARKPKQAKKVVVIARYFIKKNGHVVYLVRSSNGVDTYCTTIIDGHATGCTCKAIKPCYHMTQLEQVERERMVKVPVEQAMNDAHEAVVQMDRDCDPNAYAVLAEVKKVSVPPAEYDSCKQCGCRIAVGAGYCKRC